VMQSGRREHEAKSIRFGSASVPAPANGGQSRAQGRGPDASQR
jgi:hypothetical protein